MKPSNTETNPFLAMWDEVEAASPPPTSGNKITTLDYSDFAEIVWGSDSVAMRQLVETIYQGGVYILKGAFSETYCNDVIENTYNLWGKSKSSFHKMYDGCPDFHRIIDHEITKAYSITAIKHAYYFFPWNDDPIDLFESVNSVWRVYKFLGGYPARSYETNIPSDGVIDRIQIVQYPIGAGELRRHTDPTKNQRVVIGAMLSKRGVDFDTGGFYVYDNQNRKMDIEAYLDTGDMLCCYPTVHHGVNIVDEAKSLDWETMAGRWYLGLYSNDSDHVRDRVTGSRVEA